jgi:O-methyltransferase
MNLSVFNPYTIIAQSEIDYLFSLCVEMPKIGDIIVAGTWKGGDIAMFLHCTDRKVIAVDSFQGVSKPCDKDGDELSEGKIMASISEFMHTQEMLKTDISRLSIYPIFIDKESIKEVKTDNIAILWLDLDLYEPTKVCLEYFVPKLLPGGICVVHDYALSITPGVKRACDELGLQFEYASGGIYRLVRQ